MNLLDMRTIIYSYLVSNAVCMGVMTSLWWQNRRRLNGLGYWLADFILQFIAILLIALRGLVPDYISMVVSNALVVSGTFLLLEGLGRYLGIKIRQVPNILYLMVFVIIHSYFTIRNPSLMARNFNASIGIFISCTECAWLLFASTKPNLRKETRMVGWILLFYALFSLVRIYIDATTLKTNDFFQSGLYDSLIFMAYQFMFVVLTFSLFLMVNRRLFNELEADISLRKRVEDELRISEEKFSGAFQNHPDAVAITTMENGQIIETNAGFVRMSGYEKEEIIGKSTIELKMWEYPKERRKYVQILQKTGAVQNHEASFRRKSGEVFPGWISSSIIKIQNSNFLLSVIKDVTEQKKIRDTLELDSQMMANISDGIFIYKDRDGKIMSTNRQFEKLFGYEHNELIGKPVAILNAPGSRTPQKVADNIHTILRKRGCWDGEIRNIKKDGTIFWTHAGISSFNHPEYGKVWITVQQDITDRKQAEIKLEYLGTHDSLTSLYNRTFFDEEFKRMEKGRQFPVSVMMVDVNELKKVNDQFGHPMGDALLKRCADILTRSLRAADVLARIGGDEFAALLPALDENHTLDVVARIQKNLVDDNKEQEIPLDLSIGVSTAHTGADLQNAMAEADARMYEQKRKIKQSNSGQASVKKDEVAA